MPRSIFAMELCLRFDAGLPSALVPMLQRESDRPSPNELWTLWTQAARHLLWRKNAWVSGCWDYWDETNKAVAMYPDWVGSLMKEDGARTAPSGSNDPYRGNGEAFMTLTMACLLVHGTQSERAMAATCEIPESRLWHSASFERILQGIGNINFAVVDRATLYLIPRDDGWALTPDDLRNPKFGYLRPIL